MFKLRCISEVVKEKMRFCRAVPRHETHWDVTIFLRWVCEVVEVWRKDL